MESIRVSFRKLITFLFSNAYKKNRFQRYLFPIITVGFVILLKLFIRVVFTEYTTHLLPLVIILSAWYGGAGPGLLATFLVAVLDTFVFLLPGVSYFDADNLLSSVILILVGIIISFISETRIQAEKQKDEFIGFASHELKNPLATIQGYAQILQKASIKIPQKKQTQISGSIEEQAKRATNLINELLDLTKIETGKLSFHEEKFPIHDLVTSTIRDQKIIQLSHRIILKGKTTKKVFADRYRLGQVLINLITNAIKYSPNANKVIVTISTRKGEVVISVQDFGKGISLNNIPRIFDAYFRESSADKDKIQGLGLGLYISSEIVKRHHGKLWVESKEGSGSTFYLSLPSS